MIVGKVRVPYGMLIWVARAVVRGHKYGLEAGQVPTTAESAAFFHCVDVADAW